MGGTKWALVSILYIYFFYRHVWWNFSPLHLPQIEIDGGNGSFRKLNMIRAKYARCEGDKI